MIHPDTALLHISDTIGYGVVATKLIPKGTITWVADDFDQRFSRAQVAGMDPLHRAVVDKYAYLDGQGEYVLCWDHGRYVNHSCQPTCLAAGFDFELAMRDILPGEQLTDDYGTLNLEAPLNCACDAPNCRGIIRPDDADRLTPHWDDLVAAVFPLVNAVSQPLWPLVREKDEVQAVLRTGTRPPSCRRHFWQPILAS